MAAVFVYIICKEIYFEPSCIATIVACCVTHLYVRKMGEQGRRVVGFAAD